MNNLKILITQFGTTSTQSEIHGTQDEYPAPLIEGSRPAYEILFKIWRFKIYVCDLSFHPIKNLDMIDFTFEFLDASSVAFFQSSPGNSRSKIQKSAHGGGHYFFNVWQPTSLQNLHTGDYEVYPSEYLEVKIDSSTTNSSGFSLFHLT